MRVIFLLLFFESINCLNISQEILTLTSISECIRYQIRHYECYHNADTFSYNACPFDSMMSPSSSK